MGAACCCLRDDCELFHNPSSSLYRNCICVRCFVQNFLHLYASLFHRGDEHALPSSTQTTGSLSTMASLDNSIADMYRSPPRPLPYDTDPRYFRLQRDGLVSRREKGSSHSHDQETEPLRASEDDEEAESMGKKNKWNEFTCEDGSKEYNSKLSLKLSTAKTTGGFAHICTSDDEDVCPTCLEEYTKENPKIMTSCSHHFHLGCIYEWMERSDNCPVCGTLMAFDESP